MILGKQNNRQELDSMSKLVINSLGSGYASTEKLNEALQAIATEFNDKVLYRDNPTGSPNSMSNDLDMNNHQLLNVGSLQTTNFILDGKQILATADLVVGDEIVSRQRVFTSIAALQAATPLYIGESVKLSAGGRSGDFTAQAGDYTSQVASDPLQGIYVATAQGAAASCWVRELQGFVTPEMFGWTAGDMLSVLEYFRDSDYSEIIVEVGLENLTLEQLVRFLIEIKSSNHSLWIKTLYTKKNAADPRLLDTVIQVSTLKLNKYQSSASRLSTGYNFVNRVCRFS